MKKLYLLFLIIPLLFFSCAGMSLFPAPAEPYCTPEEQKDSLIYEFLDPDTADFTIALGSAAYIDKYRDNPAKHKEKLDQLIKAYNIIKVAVEEGLTYNALFEKVQEELGTYTAIVISRFVSRFKGVNLPIKTCDKRLILGHIERQNNLFNVMK